MPLISLTLRNFRSYSNCKLESLHRGLNMIVGPNGYGKSNILRSLLFIFSDTMELSATEFNAYAHKGVADASNQDIEVDAVIDNSDGAIPTSGKTIKLTRRWTAEGKDELLINDRSTTRQQFSAMIDCLGLVYSNPYNIVQQGKISQITLMSDQELYKMLEQSTGIRHYQLKIRESETNLAKATKQRNQTEVVASELDNKLKGLVQRKADFEAYQKDANYRQQRIAKDAWLQLNALNTRLNKIRQEQSDNEKQVADLQSRRNKAQESLHDLHQECGILRQKLAYYCSEQVPLSLVVTQQQDQSYEARDLIQTLEDKQRQIRTLFKAATSRYQKAKQNLAVSNRAYEDRKIAAQIGINNNNAIDDSLEAYTTEIKQKQQEVDDLRKTVTRLSQSKVKQEATQEKTQLQALRSRLVSLEESNRKNKTNIRDIKVKQVQCNRKINELQIEIKNKEASFDGQFSRFSNRIGHLVNFQLLRSLEQRGIKGVYGYLIDFLMIEPDVSFAYEIASKNRFFALIVQDQQTIKEVLKVAQSIKVRQLNMYSLESLRVEPQDHKKIPQTEDVYSLINESWVKTYVPRSAVDIPSDLLQNIKKLVNNIVGRHLLVRDYQTALRVAKEYHMNCITAEHEIVYADAFTCRVGVDQKTAECKLTIYNKLLTKKAQLTQMKDALTKEQKLADQLNNAEIEFTRLDKSASQDIRRLQQQIGIIQQTQSEIEQAQAMQAKKKDELAMAQVELDRLIKNRSQLAEAKNRGPASWSEVQQLGKQYQSRLQQANEAMDEYFVLENQLTELEETKKRTNLRFEELQKIEENSKTVASLNPEMTVNKLKRDLHRLQQHLQAADRQVRQLQEREQQARDTVKEMVQQLSVHNIERDVLEKKARNYDEEAIEPDQVSVNSVANRLYTAGDKVFFSRLSKIYADFEELKQRISQYEQIEAELIIQLEKCQRETLEVRNKIVSVFSKQLDQVVGRMMPTFKPDIRLTTDRSNNRIGLEISLTSDGINRKWREYSGGQKTAISICLLTAIQECSPALFYVFDEVDAPLDSTYRQRLSQLFLEKSTQSQYFITSFKKDMLCYDEADCQYYEVASQNRRSNISRVSRDRAVRVLEQVQQQ